MVSIDDWVDYLEHWDDGDNSVVDPQPDIVILADYSYEDYMGDAWFVYIKNGIVYEGHGSHCSCYGLEGQFEPEEVGTIEQAILIMERRISKHEPYSLQDKYVEYVVNQLKEVNKNESKES